MVSGVLNYTIRGDAGLEPLAASSPFVPILLLLTVLAVATAIAGAWVTSLPAVSRRVVPFSGAVLVLIALGWIWPELAASFGWPEAAAILAAGIAVVWVIDRYLYPVCPTCAHTHDHEGCSTRLHGFASPLVFAVAVHSLFDGWALVAGSAALGRALTIAVAVHKIPEALAASVILRAALRSRRAAIAWAAATQMMMLVGGLLERAAAPRLSPSWFAGVLALAGGTFLYLGAHAMHGEWKRRTAAQPTT